MVRRILCGGSAHRIAPLEITACRVCVVSAAAACSPRTVICSLFLAGAHLIARCFVLRCFCDDVDSASITFLTIEIPRVVPQFIILLFAVLFLLFALLGTFRIANSRRLYSALTAAVAAGASANGSGSLAGSDSMSYSGGVGSAFDRFGNPVMTGDSGADRSSVGRSGSLTSQFAALNDRQRMLLGLPSSGRRDVDANGIAQRRLAQAAANRSYAALSRDYKTGARTGPGGDRSANGAGTSVSGVLSPRSGLASLSGPSANGSSQSLRSPSLHLFSPTPIHPGASPQRARARDSSAIVDQRGLDEFLDRYSKKEVEFVSSVAAAANAAYGQMDLYGSPIRSPYGMRSPYMSRLPTSYGGAAGSVYGGGYGSPLAAMQPSTVSPFASSPQYAQAYRDVPDPASVSATDQRAASDERSDLELAEAAEKVYRDLGIESDIGRWGQQARSWLTAAIIQPLARDFRDSNKQLEQLATEILNSPSVVMMSADDRAVLESVVHSRSGSSGSGSSSATGLSGGDGGYGSSSGSGSGSGGAAAANQAQLDQSLVTLFLNNPAYSNITAVVARKKLERYLAIRLGGSVAGAGSAPVGTNVKAYALARITELAKGQYMSAFRWDRGADWAGKPWASHLPTDTQLLCHVFLTFMDEVVLHFAKQHFDPFNEKRCTYLPPACLLSCSPAICLSVSERLNSESCSV